MPFLSACTFVFLRGVCRQVSSHLEGHLSDPRPSRGDRVLPGEAAAPRLRPSLFYPARRVSEREVPGAGALGRGSGQRDAGRDGVGGADRRVRHPGKKGAQRIPAARVPLPVVLWQ